MIEKSNEKWVIKKQLIKSKSRTAFNTQYIIMVSIIQ